jgi:hypothetical protein
VTADLIDRLIQALSTSMADWFPDHRKTTAAMMLHRWHDATAAQEAVDVVISTWTEKGRPPWAVLHSAYLNAMARRGLRTGPRHCTRCDGTGFISEWKDSPLTGLPTSYARKCDHQEQDHGDVIHPRLGLAIARASYEAECARQGRKPTPGVLEGDWMEGLLTDS